MRIAATLDSPPIIKNFGRVPLAREPFYKKVPWPPEAIPGYCNIQPIPLKYKLINGILLNES